MFRESVANQGHTIAVWMFADWIGRNPHVITNSREQSPPTWTSEQWHKAAQLEEALRLFNSGDAELDAVKRDTPDEIRKYIRADGRDLVRADDGILRRFPDQLLQILMMGHGNDELDAAGAMKDAMEIARNIKRGP
ncbi:hypothetical protein [Paraburkholderia terrae]|uniref:hypothetical protein n=1 Tax=Paraburkholderia terrae TaxID=311230 RepID=UPI002069F5A5|nr:hypothetical protein [Paraburkholderia terrae]BDC45423.1 hypothetical protein PTKU15_87200 [Paraburkholderia terrae]